MFFLLSLSLSRSFSLLLLPVFFVSGLFRFIFFCARPRALVSMATHLALAEVRRGWGAKNSVNSVNSVLRRPRVLREARGGAAAKLGNDVTEFRAGPLLLSSSSSSSSSLLLLLMLFSLFSLFSFLLLLERNRFEK